MTRSVQEDGMKNKTALYKTCTERPVKDLHDKTIKMTRPIRQDQHDKMCTRRQFEKQDRSVQDLHKETSKRLA